MLIKDAKLHNKYFLSTIFKTGVILGKLLEKIKTRRF